LATKFRGVETEDDFLRGVDHGALNVDEQAVGIRDAFERNAAGAHDGNVGMDFGKSFNCDRTHQDPEPWVNDATRHDHFKAISRGKQIRNGQRVGDNLRRFRFQIFGDVVNRSACVEDDSCVNRNKVGANPTDGFFLVDLVGVPRGEGELVRPGGNQPSAAMGSFYRSGRLQD